MKLRIRLKPEMPEPFCVYCADGVRRDFFYEWEEIESNLITEYMRGRRELEIEEVPNPTTQAVEEDPPVIAETEVNTVEFVPIQYEPTPEVVVPTIPAKPIKRRKRRARKNGS